MKELSSMASGVHETVSQGIKESPDGISISNQSHNMEYEVDQAIHECNKQLALSHPDIGQQP